MRAKILLIALAVAGGAWAQEIVLNPDPAHTTIHFTLPTILHTVHGTFALKRGAVRYDPSTGKISGEIVVDTTSGNSGDNARDKRMHKEILESAKYPEMSFAPDRVEGTVAPQGKSQIQVHGSFTIHGAAHEITLPVEVQMTNGHASVKTDFFIPYIKWGMKNPSTFILRVSDKVEIDASAGAVP